MENGISRLEFWSGVALALAPYIIQVVSRWMDSRDKEREIDADDELKRTEAWERLSQEYARQIESLKQLEVENGQLRPLVLKLALQDQEMHQVKDDKEDWKRYAIKLTKQLEDNKIIPLPFRRTPTEWDTGEVKKFAHTPPEPPVENDATGESPTIATNKDAGL